MTLEDCIETVREPERYLRGILRNMLDCKREQGTAFVRIGLTGEGIAPNYLVTSNESDPDGFPFGSAKYMRAFNGRTHHSLFLKDHQLIGCSWSRDVAEGARVYDLLKAVKGEVSHPTAAKSARLA